MSSAVRTLGFGKYNRNGRFWVKHNYENVLKNTIIKNIAAVNDLSKSS